MPDYKQLCAELAEDLALWLEYDGPPSSLPIEEGESRKLLARARAALAETEPEAPTELSPAAKAVLNAAHDGANQVLFDIGDDDPIPSCAAAALRAAAYQVAPARLVLDSCCEHFEQAIRHKLLAIANELEAQ